MQVSSVINWDFARFALSSARLGNDLFSCWSRALIRDFAVTSALREFMAFLLIMLLLEAYCFLERADWLLPWFIYVLKSFPTFLSIVVYELTEFVVLSLIDIVEPFVVSCKSFEIPCRSRLFLSFVLRLRSASSSKSYLHYMPRLVLYFEIMT